MGRPLFYDTETGDYNTLENGKPRPLTDEEFLTVTMPDNRQGVSLSERAIAMSLTNDSVAAERYLESQGYFVKRYGDGWNMAVQKRAEGQTAPDPNKWSVVDPRGALDSVKDIFLDNAGYLGAGVLSDAGRFLGAAGGAVTGAVAGGGLPGGIVGGALGSIAGAGGGAAGGELLRQKLGQSLGVPQEIDDDQIIAAGLIGSAVPIVGPAAGRLAMKGGSLIKAGAGKAIRGAGEVALQLGSKFAGLEQQKSLISGAEALLTRAASTAHFPEIVAQLKLMRQRVGAVFSNLSPEVVQKEQMLVQTPETFDLRPLLKTLVTAPKSAIKADKDAMRKNYLEVVERVRSLLGAYAPRPQAPGSTPAITSGPDVLLGQFRVPAQKAAAVVDPLKDAIRRVPASVVDEIRQVLGNMGDFNEASKLKGATEISSTTAQRASGALGATLRERLGKTFDGLMTSIQEQMTSANDLNEAIGHFTQTGRAVGLKQGSEGTLRRTFQQGASDFLDAVQRFDKWHKTDFEKPLRQAVIGERFSGPGGTPARTLRPTVAGGVFGSGAIQSATGLQPKGGITGALARATGAFGIGTEAGIVGATRFVRGIPVTPLGRAGRRIRIGGAATGKAAGKAVDFAGDLLASAPSRAAQVAALQQAIRQQMAQQPLIEGSDMMMPNP